jgi:cell wall-associated NlpC family hydrolase
VAVNGVALGAVAAGAVFVYASVKGKSVLASVQAIVAGKSPATAAAANPITPAPVAAGAAAAGGTASGSAIASDALQYVGQGYTYGGPSAPGRWDCSSFASYVLGHDMGLPIPGGSWATVTANGTQHGPTTLSYLLFGTAISQADARPGDLIVSVDHMGIIISATQMVSARDPASGTGISNWPAGFPAGPPVYRRVG